MKNRLFNIKAESYVVDIIEFGIANSDTAVIMVKNQYTGAILAILCMAKFFGDRFCAWVEV